jgi:hypothetical protein
VSDSRWHFPMRPTPITPTLMGLGMVDMSSDRQRALCVCSIKCSFKLKKHAKCSIFTSALSENQPSATPTHQM